MWYVCESVFVTVYECMSLSIFLSPFPVFHVNICLSIRFPCNDPCVHPVILCISPQVLLKTLRPYSSTHPVILCISPLGAVEDTYALAGGGVRHE